MRRLNYFFAILVMCVLCGCSDSDNGSSVLSVGSDILSFSYEGGTQSLTINSDGKWGITKMPEWLSASVASGTGNGEVKLTAVRNESRSDRSGFVLVYSDNAEQNTVVQVDQTGTHASQITFDSQEEKVFGGRASTYLEESVKLMCDTEWEVEGPAWMNLVYDGEVYALGGKTHHKGSGTIYLLVNETYTGDDARRDTVYFRTLSGESDAKIPVCQLGKNDIHCIKPILSPEGFMCMLKSGSNVESMVIMVFEDGKQPSPLTDDVFYYWHSKQGAINVDPGDGTYFVSYFYFPKTFGDNFFQSDTDYNIYMLGINSSGDYAPLSKVSQYTFHTLSDTQILPKVEINNVVIENGKLLWTVSPNEYTSMYMTQVYSKNEWQEIGITMPQQLALSLAWQYKYGSYSGHFSDIEKNFSRDLPDGIGINDIWVLALPYGTDYTPSSISVYDPSNP
jgi:hypothetical protein